MANLSNWGKYFSKDTEGDLPIPYRPLSKDRKTTLENILRSSNILLKNYHEKTQEEISRVDFFKAIYANRSLGATNVYGVDIPQEDSNKILDVKNIEWEILCGFSRLIAKLANKWSKRDIDLSLSFDDLFSEATKATLFAMLHFTENNVSFCTFLHHCINRQLSKLCNKTNGLSHLSTGAVELKRRYLELASEEGANFDAIVSKLNLSKKEIRTLQNILFKVKNQTSLGSDEESNELDQVATVEDKNFDFDSTLIRVVGDIEFSELERSVLEGFMSSSSGKLGLNCCSKNLINPKTNKPYSRMAFTLAWKRIKEKIHNAYGKVA